MSENIHLPATDCTLGLGFFNKSTLNSEYATSDDEEDEVKGNASFQKRRQKFLDSDDGSSDSNRCSPRAEGPSESSTTILPQSIDKLAVGMGDEAKSDSSSCEDLNLFKRKPVSLKLNNSSSSDEELSNKSEAPSPTSGNESRIKSRQRQLKSKFSNLKSSKGIKKIDDKKQIRSSDDSGNDDTEEMFSIESIKKKIEERNKILKSTIYDSDSSDDEKAHIREAEEKSCKHNHGPSKSGQRMSAKQAMENMKKIKSESNRMLREKEVSLPYHRPKALSLKDIMARRKPALTADGKALPLKMNKDQLEQYAQILEERQKVMMELCKSDSEDDAPEDNTPADITPADNKELNNQVTDAQNTETDKIDTIPEITDAAKNVSDVVEEQTEIDKNLNNDNLYDSMVLEASKEITNNIMEISNTVENNSTLNIDNVEDNNINNIPVNNCTESESQLIALHLTESEKLDSCLDDNNAETKITEETNIESSSQPNKEAGITTDNNLINDVNIETNPSDNIVNDNTEKDDKNPEADIELDNRTNDNEFPDDEDDINMDDIDQMIENAEIIDKNTNIDATDSPMLIREPYNPSLRPKVAGAPGMVIDLDGSNALGPRKSGIELLKDRFVYFAKLKTPEEIEKQQRNRINPGTQHLKLKLELEEQIAEQRALEWAKRLEEEKQQQAELNAIRGDASDDEDIDKLEAKLADDVDMPEESSEGESEPEENDMVIEDKPRERNALVDDEAEESEEEKNNEVNEDNEHVDEDGDDINEGDVESGDESSEEDSSDDEMGTVKPKKGRIIKAFEDSDDEADTEKQEKVVAEIPKDLHKTNNSKEACEKNETNNENDKRNHCDVTEDDDLQSAQLQKSVSEDVFTSQDNETESSSKTVTELSDKITFTDFKTPNVEKSVDKLSVISETQPFDEGKFDDIVGMCSGSFSQNMVTTQQVTQNYETTQRTQDINDDLLNMCTGKFFDNQFVSQTNDNGTDINTTKNNTSDLIESTDNIHTEKLDDSTFDKTTKDQVNSAIAKPADENLQSILDELHDPEFDKPKLNKFFSSPANSGGGTTEHSSQFKKRLVIDSDDEDNANKTVDKPKKRKKKLEQRALKISDDEDSEADASSVEEEYESAVEEDDDNNPERVVEYDSEENEVEIEVSNKKGSSSRKLGGEFFEREAELSSEDEWAGSGDEDEAGLDRMEREAGDDDTFHQGRLQRELERIHMRDVLDQDKREVRMIQELLLEDGDLGGGHRQRKFRWKNANGDTTEELGSLLEEAASTQEMEEELQAEEQWRRQRHERAMFLMKINQKEEDNLEDLEEVSFNQSATTVTTMNISADSTRTNQTAPLFDKKSAKDLPSPVKKPFTLLQPNVQGSILSRGSGALARLAGLATTLAGDGTEQSAAILQPSGKRNFVFATLSPTADAKPKIVKRKADNIGTPNLMKKLKTEENRRTVKTSLFDHLK